MPGIKLALLTKVNIKKWKSCFSPLKILDYYNFTLDHNLYPTPNAVSNLDLGAAGPDSRFLPHHSSGGRGRGDMFGHGPEFGQNHTKPFPYHSPGRDHLGSPSHRFGGPSGFPRGSAAFEDNNSREALRFGEGSMPYSISSELVRNPNRDGRFPPLPGHLRRGDIDDPVNLRFGEHRAPGLVHNQIGGDDGFGPDGPGHFMKGKFSGPGYLSGNFPGQGRAGEVAGNFPRPPFSDSLRGDVPGFPRNNYPYHAMPNDPHFPVSLKIWFFLYVTQVQLIFICDVLCFSFQGGLDSFEQSRKRKPISNGWCRICEIDCETIEGLEMHSQTREHQNMAMDMVKHIKLQNKKQR